MIPDPQNPAGPPIVGSEFENTVQRSVNNTHTYATGQFGAGLEVRITRHVGIMGDFAWNVVQENDNDFGMARFGVTLSY